MDMNPGERKAQKPQNILIVDRKIFNSSGVIDVISFDDTNIVLKTVLGTMSLDGLDLHITKLNLDEGEIQVGGTVNGLYFISQSDDAPKVGKFKRLLR